MDHCPYLKQLIYQSGYKKSYMSLVKILDQITHQDTIEMIMSYVKRLLPQMSNELESCIQENVNHRIQLKRYVINHHMQAFIRQQEFENEKFDNQIFKYMIILLPRKKAHRIMSILLG